jgi:dTDP-glucose 4,6-dehydratase
MKVLITGGMGFAGSHFVEGLLKETDWDIVVLDRLDVSGNPNRLTDIKCWKKEQHRVKFIWWDLKSALNDYIKTDIGNVDYIWHVAASSHVDRSIEDPLSFVMDNVVGTCNILNFARTLKELKLFITLSTDEVFGPAPEGVSYKEWDRYNSGNPYAASKAGEEELSLAFCNTYKLPIIICHCMNIFGERQHPEKFIPLVIKKTLMDEVVTIHADKTKTKAGIRSYIHARTVLKAFLFLTKNHKIGDKYNIVGEKEMDNLALAQLIVNVMKKRLKYEMADWHSSRPGHDTRYMLDGTKLKDMGFIFPSSVEDSLTKTVLWYLKPENLKWLGIS